MKSDLMKYASQFIELNDEEALAIAELIPIKEFKRGTILVREGEIMNHCYFVMKGCVRKYHLQDGIEKTTAFFTEQQAVMTFNSFSEQIPIDHYYACVEDCTLVVGNLATEHEMYQRYPKLEGLTRTLMEQDLGQTKADFAHFISSTPEQRYQYLLETRPTLFQRVPQHQIASYLGLTPESLSRIKKRLQAKK